MTSFDQWWDRVRHSGEIWGLRRMELAEVAYKAGMLEAVEIAKKEIFSHEPDEYETGWNSGIFSAATAIRQAAEDTNQPKFQETFCSNCGKGFGPGDHGFSHCENHKHLTPIDN